MEPINQFLDTILKTPQKHVICTYVQNVENERAISKKARFLGLSHAFQSIFKLLAVSMAQHPKQLMNTNSQFFGNRCKDFTLAKIYSTTHLTDSNTLYLLEPTTITEFNSILQKIQQSQTQNNIYLWVVPSDNWDIELTIFAGLPNPQTIDLTQIWTGQQINQWLSQNKKMQSTYDKELEDWFIAKITGNQPLFLSELNHPILIARKELMGKLIDLHRNRINPTNLDMVLQWGNIELGIACRSTFKILL